MKVTECPTVEDVAGDHTIKRRVAVVFEAFWTCVLVRRLVRPLEASF